MCYPSTQTKKKEKRSGIIYETFLLFSLMYFIYLFITAINADVKAVRVKPTISLTSTNENPSICMTVRVMAPPSRMDCEGSFKDGLKTHILNPLVERDANKPYRSYLITTMCTVLDCMRHERKTTIRILHFMHFTAGERSILAFYFSFHCSLARHSNCYVL